MCQTLYIKVQRKNIGAQTKRQPEVAKEMERESKNSEFTGLGPRTVRGRRARSICGGVPGSGLGD